MEWNQDHILNPTAPQARKGWFYGEMYARQTGG